jgi:hypothetical protein
VHVSPPRRKEDCKVSLGYSKIVSTQEHTGDASASGHITPSFGGITVAVIGAETGAGGGGAALMAAPPDNAG